MHEFDPKYEKINVGKLMATIGRLHSRTADRYMESTGLFRGQAILLMILSDKDGQTHSEIADKLEISPAAATKVIKRMEELKYVQRQPDPKDERISRVFIREEGWAMIHQIRSNFDRIDQILVKNLSPDEEKTLVSLLMKVYNNLLENVGGDI
jgi:MarR family transcriptional regulator, organic hydroperoxide resistance regulator